MAPSPSHSQSLLPNPRILILDRIERDSDRFRLRVHAEQEPSCPVCGEVSWSRHSVYSRRLQDFPWQGVAVELWASVGRFRCRNSSCPRKIFCERLPQIARVYGRQTERASEVVRLIGYVAGGLPGQRLLARLSISTSDDTVLRRVREKPTEASSIPIHNLGVDDWAWRKGQDYGTILVNLDLHRVVDLLPDRAAESFSAWLKQHLEIVTISRDRCGLYAEGATLGAPQSQQVADRFHLLVNLSATMERVLEERSRQLILPPIEQPPAEPLRADVADVGKEPPPPVPPRVTQSQLRRQRRLERYQQVMALFHSGQSQAAISRALGMGRKTIRRWLRRGEFPEREPPHRPPPKVSEFADYLQQRWNEGCHNASRLYQEIRQKGYAGKHNMVRRFVSGWRRTGKATSPDAPQRISPKHAAILVTRPADKVTDEQQQLLNRIETQCPEVADLRKISLGFRAALVAEDSQQLRRWIEGAKHSEFGPVVRFAYGLQKDISAVAAAVDTSWSTGQVEGQINRLKMIKRQMYGRAGFELLRARVLAYSP
ncbi:MAG TPA: ISL3 family transposase, partial [Xanthobacteraceae bacterium]|nr:ISL3 family transposase [Xanthobacteraceae bacterium]